MSDHYYTNEPSVESNQERWHFTLRGKKFHFTTDAGVFSKGTVDYGSRLLIELFEEPNVAGNLLDVGCGYGPIGLSLAHAYPERTVEMIDVNERALKLAKQNAADNQMKNVKIYQSAAYEHVTGTFAAIVTNPPIRAGKQVVHEILAEAYDHLEPGGTLTAVIQKKQGAASAEKKMLEVFGNATRIARDKGYWIIQSEK